MQLNNHGLKKKSIMTQRTLQLTQRGSSLVILLIVLNSLYILISTFEKALSLTEK